MFSNKRFLTLAAALSLAVFVGEGFISSAEAASRSTCRATRTELKKQKLKLKGETTRLTSSKRSLSRFEKAKIVKDTEFKKRDDTFTAQFVQLSKELAKKLESSTGTTAKWGADLYDGATPPAQIPAANHSTTRAVSAKGNLSVDHFLLAAFDVRANPKLLEEGTKIDGREIKEYLDQITGPLPADVNAPEYGKIKAQRAEKLASANVTVVRILDRLADAEAFALERGQYAFDYAAKLNLLKNGKKGVNASRDGASTIETKIGTEGSAGPPVVPPSGIKGEIKRLQDILNSAICK
jgi:hypothetical protein